MDFPTLLALRRLEIDRFACEPTLGFKLAMAAAAAMFCYCRTSLRFACLLSTPGNHLARLDLCRSSGMGLEAANPATVALGVVGASGMRIGVIAQIKTVDHDPDHVRVTAHSARRD